MVCGVTKLGYLPPSYVIRGKFWWLDCGWMVCGENQQCEGFHETSTNSPWFQSWTFQEPWVGWSGVVDIDGWCVGFGGWTD